MRDDHNIKWLLSFLPVVGEEEFNTILKGEMEKGLSPNARYRSQNWSNDTSILICAIKHRRYATVELLLQMGANPNHLTFHLTLAPLYYAAMEMDIRMMELICKYGGDCNLVYNQILQSFEDKCKNNVIAEECGRKIILLDPAMDEVMEFLQRHVTGKYVEENVIEQLETVTSANEIKFKPEGYNMIDYDNLLPYIRGGRRVMKLIGCWN